MSLIDLSLLPPPAVVEALDFEALLAARKARLLELTPEADRPAVAATLALESEPIAKLLQESAYHELVLRQRINDAARANMLATATGADLDNLAALLGVQRLALLPADLEATPPVLALLESDADLRRRAQLAIEGTTVAGSRGAYLYHALGAHTDVADAAVDSPAPGEVRVAVLSRTGDGAPAADVIDAVRAALSAEDVRPLCDYVAVEPAQIVPFAVAAVLHADSGPAAASALAAAHAALADYLARPRRIGASVPRSAIYAALHQPGVTRVELVTPAADIVLDARQAAHCTSVALSAEVSP